MKTTRLFPFIMIALMVIVTALPVTLLAQDDAPIPTAEAADTDGDGIMDDADVCPNAIGDAATNGCPAGADLAAQDAGGAEDVPVPTPEAGDDTMTSEDTTSTDTTGTDTVGTDTVGDDTLPPVDSDGDGFLDAFDACPDENAEGNFAAEGCPPPAEPAASEAEPDESGDDTVTDGDSAEEESPNDTDFDGDGILNDEDACPTTPMGADGADGCPPEALGEGPEWDDQDDDGIINWIDACDDQPGDIMDNGCPAGVSPDQGGGAAETDQPAQATAPAVAVELPLADGDCPGSLPTRLEVGGEGEIVDAFSTLRATPDGLELSRVDKPATFTVLEGPVCVSSLTWFRIEYPDGATGWALESQLWSIYGLNQYWLAPVE